MVPESGDWGRRGLVRGLEKSWRSPESAFTGIRGARLGAPQIHTKSSENKDYAAQIAMGGRPRIVFSRMLDIMKGLTTVGYRNTGEGGRGRIMATMRRKPKRKDT